MSCIIKIGAIFIWSVCILLQVNADRYIESVRARAQGNGSDYFTTITEGDSIEVLCTINYKDFSGSSPSFVPFWYLQYPVGKPGYREVNKFTHHRGDGETFPRFELVEMSNQQSITLDQVPLHFSLITLRCGVEVSQNYNQYKIFDPNIVVVQIHLNPTEPPTVGDTTQTQATSEESSTEFTESLTNDVPQFASPSLGSSDGNPCQTMTPGATDKNTVSVSGQGLQQTDDDSQSKNGTQPKDGVPPQLKDGVSMTDFIATVAVMSIVVVILFLALVIVIYRSMKLKRGPRSKANGTAPQIRRDVGPPPLDLTTSMAVDEPPSFMVASNKGRELLSSTSSAGSPALLLGGCHSFPDNDIQKHNEEAALERSKGKIK